MTKLAENGGKVPDELKHQRELNYTGDTNDSASMNLLLHKRVMVVVGAANIMMGGK